MPIFDIEAGGKTYEVEAPDMQSATQAFQSFSSAAPPEPTANERTRDYLLTGAPDQRQEALPEWMQKARQYTDPMQVLGGLPATLGMALPAGRGARTAPTSEALHTAGARARDTMKANNNVAIDGRKVTSFFRNLKTGLKRDGYYPIDGNAAGTHAVIDDVRPGGPFFSDGKNLNVNDYLALRSSLQKTAQNFKQPKDQKAASIAIDRLDSLFDKTAQGNFVGGTPDQIARVRALGKESRANFAAGYRSDLLSKKEYEADLSANANYSGMNLDNALRRKVAGVLTSPKSRQGFTPSETGTMDQLVRGKAPGQRGANTARVVGNVMGGGLGIPAMISAGVTGGGLAAAGHPGKAALAMAVPATGWAIKKAENALTQRALTKLGQTVRMRSPLGTATQPGPYSPEALAIKLLSLEPSLIEAGSE